ncbi:MAG: TfoX/Sxy family protein [Bacteroidota bacterium]
MFLGYKVKIEALTRAITESYADYIRDQLSGVEGFNFKKMFGGIGIFRDGVMFGLINKGDIFRLRTDETNREMFESRGYEIWNHGRGTMPYHEVPAEVVEDRQALAEWAEISYEVALRHKKPKKK